MSSTKTRCAQVATSLLRVLYYNTGTANRWANSPYLLPCDAHVIPHIGENRGLNEKAFQAQSFASTLQLGSFADAALDVLQHAVLLLAADLWRWRGQEDGVREASGETTQNEAFRKRNAEEYRDMWRKEKGMWKTWFREATRQLSGPTCGPCSVVGSKGLPTILLLALSTLLRTNSSYMGSSTKMREPAVQHWPALKKTPWWACSTARFTVDNNDALTITYYGFKM